MVVGDRKDQKAMAQARSCTCGFDQLVDKLVKKYPRHLGSGEGYFGLAYLHHLEGCEGFKRWAKQMGVTL